MALIKDGYFQDTYWPSRYWQEDYWLEYGAPAAPSAVGIVPSRAKLRRDRWLLLYKLKQFLEAELGE